MRVHAGQVYKSNDPRDHGRYREVISVRDTHAMLQPVWQDDTGEFREDSGRVSRIRVKSLGTRAQTGYTLVYDPNMISFTMKVWGQDPDAKDKAQAFLLEAAEQIMDMGLEVSLDVGDK
jgi:hypothetical protein